MAVIKTPGVYIEEVRVPPAITQVASHIPTFIGYTQKDETAGKPVRIRSLLEYQSLFGTITPQRNIEIQIADENAATLAIQFTAGKAPVLKSYFYHSLEMFFNNGGGDCFIISAGTDINMPGELELINALNKAASIDETSLLIVPDAVLLSKESYYRVINQMLEQCKLLQDRFAIIDVMINLTGTGTIADFRNNIATSRELAKNGAAYYPYLNTSLAYNFSDEEQVMILNRQQTLKQIANTNPSFYFKIKQALSRQSMCLPASGAVAGAYVSVDINRGVWKAPANVSLHLVNSPSLNIDDRQQDSLNVDANLGKSINAIRQFTGKGTMIWGARTLAGNDNEWRYVPVRRLFIMVEESIKKSTGWLVFEPNDANTWVRIKHTIENYLLNLWRSGALMGAKPEEAFYVHVGLGATMTALDILEGRLIVEIGMAVVRPAEFIILKFSHKMQQDTTTTNTNIAGVPASLLSTDKSWTDLKLENGEAENLAVVRTWLTGKKNISKEKSASMKIKPGFRVLFQGASGTGKTLAASLLGKEVKRDVYRIDLGMLLSKYIGETEKNLEKVFDAAAQKDSVLFFDEADALFGKRTDVKDSHDKYANQEVSYLLQRMEAYNGLVIVATNMKSNIDDAFMRRFQAIIRFGQARL